MNFDEIPSAWRGHEQFAGWLVAHLKPRVIVELGVDCGFSTIAFARPNIGRIYAIDWFRGDSYVGPRNVEEQCRENLKDAGVQNVELIVGDFAEVASRWKYSVDILHIDGDHAYESVKRDFECWQRFVRPGGVILMHDTQWFPDQVGRFFGEITWPKFAFEHACGLGVITAPAMDAR